MSVLLPLRRPQRLTLFPYTTLFRSLDQAGNPLAHLASDANGMVQLPRRPGPRLRLRVGLRSEEPIEINTALLGDEPTDLVARSEEHTSELQSLTNIVCRLLLEKKNI